MNFYGLTLASAIFIGYFLVRRRANLYHISLNHIDNLFLIVIPLAVIGARVYHVLDKWEFYAQDPAQILYVWQGGLGIFGGLLGALGGVLIYWLLTKKVFSLLSFFDLVSPYLLLGQAVGRIGNFFNQEAFGPPTNLPWKVYIDFSHRPKEWENFEYFHPTFFYEALWDLVGFFVLLYLGKIFWKRRGFIFGVYLIIYGLGRFLVEFFRFDTAQLGEFKLAQIISLIFVFTGLFLSRKKGRLEDSRS